MFQVGGVTPHQIAVYEEFGRNIPGFMSSMQEATQNAQFFVKPMQVSPLWLQLHQRFEL